MVAQCPSPTSDVEGPAEPGNTVGWVTGEDPELRESTAIITSSKQACLSGRRPDAVQEMQCIIFSGLPLHKQSQEVVQINKQSKPWDFGTFSKTFRSRYGSQQTVSQHTGHNNTNEHNLKKSLCGYLKEL